MIEVGFDVRERGPLFERAVDREVRLGLEEARHAVTHQGVTEVRQQLDRVLRHPSGFYRRHIAERHKGAVDVVHDSGVVYGPWLAGTSRRNAATRFKGYAHWRRAVQRLRQRAGETAAKVIGARLRRLG